MAVLPDMHPPPAPNTVCWHYTNVVFLPKDCLSTMMSETYPPLFLKKGEERRLRAGHLWVFSNEVDTARSPLDTFEPGQPVSVVAANGKALGTGYVNPHSLICARIMSRDPRRPFDAALIAHRLACALSLRDRLFAQPYYRLAYAESDGLPGLVVDRYGDVLVAQLNTAGMEHARESVINALDGLLRPRGILLRNDSAARELEGLPASVEVGAGDIPPTVEIEENGARFRIRLTAGQKTGWYYDHRLNRARLRGYASGARVLDVFSYLGGWGIQAACAGAREVFCVEASQTAAEYIAENAALNGVADRVRALPGDAFEQLKALHQAGERFDVVILDPPAFVKRRKDLKKGLEAYQRLNQLAMQLLAKDGILATASCSFHLHADALVDTLRRASLHLDRSLQILEQGHQGPDHPVHASIPETRYLKSFICRIVYGL